MTLAELYLTDVRERMRGVKALGDRALAQLHPDDWHRVLSPGGNSAAALCGGYREGVEGEAAGRDRDAEFEEGETSGLELLARWEEGWATFFAALGTLMPDDLTRTLTIRHEPHSVLSAIQRQVAHYSGHVYQLVLLAKTLRGEDWQTLSVPRGGSAAFNAEMAGAARGVRVRAAWAGALALALVALLVWRAGQALESHAQNVRAAAEVRWKLGEAFTEVGSAEDCSGGYAGLRFPSLKACEVTRLPRGFEVDLRTAWARRTFTFFGSP